MQDNSARNPDDCPVGPAPVWASLVGGLTLLAFSVVWLNSLSLMLQLPIGLATLLLGFFATRRLLDPAVTSIRVDGLRMRVCDASGSRIDGSLSGVPFVSPFFIGIRCQVPGRRWPLTLGIFREQLDDRHYRRLCASLRQSDEP